MGILSMTQEHVEISHEHVVLGNKQVITTLCNLTTKKIITKVTPTMMSIELFDGEVSLVKYVTELTKIDVAVFKDTTELLNAVVNNVEVPYMIVVKAPVLPLEMRVDFEQSSKVWDVKINNKSYLKVRSTVPYMIVVKAPVLPLE